MAEEVIDEEVVEISDDSEEMLMHNEDIADNDSASVEISADTPQSDDLIEEEIVEEEVEVEDEEIVFERVEYEEVLVGSAHDISMGSTTLNTFDVASFAEEDVEIENLSNDAETGGETRIENLGQINDEEVVEEVVLGPDDEVYDKDSWDPGRDRSQQKVPISPAKNDDHYYNDDDSTGSHSWLPNRKQSSHDTSDGVTPRTSHRKSEGIHLEDAIKSIDDAPFSPAMSKASYDTTIKSSDTLDNWNMSPPIDSSWRNPDDDGQAGNSNDQSHKEEKDSSESDDSPLIRRQKQVQFAGLPEHPPELRKPSNSHLPSVQENNETGSSSSYETDSSEVSSVYETDSSGSEDAIVRSLRSPSTEAGRLLTVNYRPSTSVRSTPIVNPLASLSTTPVSPTSDVESQPQQEYFAPAAETRPKESEFFKAHIISLAILLLVGMALCLYFFYEFTRDENRDVIVFTATIAPVIPTTAPMRPTDQPASPTRPTDQPAFPTISPNIPPSEPTPSTPTTNAPTPNTPVPSTFSPTAIQPQNNDECVDAIGPLLPGTSIQGTSRNAREDDVDSCDNTSNNGLPGVWYYVLGNGGEMMAHTCKSTAIDSKVSVYGGPCSNPQCLEFSDNFCGKQSAVSWDSEFQKPYYILVQGRSIRRTIGNFELSIEARYNDECNNAIKLEASPDSSGPTIRGQTLEATPNSFVCNGVVNKSPSLFYSVRGTGEELAVIFQDGTDFNPKISVLFGDCSSLSCVAQSEEGEIQVSWASIRDMKYYILVHGETPSDVGNFSFHVQSANAVAQGRVPW